MPQVNRTPCRRVGRAYEVPVRYFVGSVASMDDQRRVSLADALMTFVIADHYTTNVDAEVRNDVFT